METFVFGEDNSSEMLFKNFSIFSNKVERLQFGKKTFFGKQRGKKLEFRKFCDDSLVLRIRAENRPRSGIFYFKLGTSNLSCTQIMAAKYCKKSG